MTTSSNSYSEANFKTLKNCPAFAGRFGAIHDSSYPKAVVMGGEGSIAEGADPVG